MCTVCVVRVEGQTCFLPACPPPEECVFGREVRTPHLSLLPPFFSLSVNPITDTPGDDEWRHSLSPPFTIIRLRRRRRHELPVIFGEPDDASIQFVEKESFSLFRPKAHAFF